MRAAHVERYGPPECISIVDIAAPEPRAGEVLIRVKASAVTAGDARLRSGVFPRGFGVPGRLALGVRGPRAHTPGGVLSGVVERVGSGVSAFSPGDAVAGMTGMRLGAHAEFAIAPSKSLAVKPAQVDHADAAAVLFGGSTALHFLNRAGVKPGDTVLINGASGAVGSSAVQLAAHLGASVTAVSSLANHELVRSLGARRVVNYQEQPVATLEERFDIVFDAVGNLSRREGLRLVTPDGALILAVASLGDTIRAHGRVFAGPAPERGESFRLLLEMLAAGALSPVSQVVGGLDGLVEAHRMIETRRKVGNLVILPPRPADR